MACANDLNSVIASVKKMQQPIPPVYVYTIPPQKTGISAVDVNKNSLLAYSPGHSRDIYVALNYDSEVDLTGNLSDAWARYKAARASKNNEIRMMETSSKSSRIHVLPHGAVVTGLCFVPDGNFLLSCGMDKTVKVWSTAGLKLVESYFEHGPSRVFSDVHVSSDCKYFVASLRESKNLHAIAALYSFEKNTPIATFRGHYDDIECVRFHPNGLYFATASCDKSIKLWSTRDYKELRNFRAKGFRERHPKKLAFSPDGKYLASAYDESVVIWDLKSGNMWKEFEISNSSPNILNLCYNVSGNILATGGSNKNLELWNMKIDSPRSFDVNPKDELLKCDDLEKTIYCIKNTSTFFTCVVA